MQIDNLALLDLQEATGIRSVTEMAIFVEVVNAPNQTAAWYAKQLNLSRNTVSVILAGLDNNARRKTPLGLVRRVGSEWELSPKGRKAIKGF